MAKKNNQKQSLDPTKYYFYKRVRKVIYADPEDKTSDVLDIKSELVIDREVDIQEYVNSFADTVGPQAIVQRMNDGVDVTDLLNTKPSLNAGQDGVVDASPYIGDGGQAYDRLKAAAESFDKLDPALKGEATDINSFLSGLTQESIDAYIQSRVDALTQKGNVNNEN